MREAKYITHEGYTVEFNVSGGNFTLNPLPLRTFNITPQVLNNHISSFVSNTVTTYPVEIGVVGATPAIASREYDRLISLLESDVEALLPGTLVINGYSISCYINGVMPSVSLRRGKLVTATVTAENPTWYKELLTYIFTPEMSFTTNSPSTTETNPIDYPHDYPYDYGAGIASDIVNNTALKATHFRMIIEGAIDNPTVTIGGHIYSVSVNVLEGSRLIIDSREETLLLVDESGNQTNVFDKRNRESDIFQKIPVGESEIIFTGISKLFLTIIEERRFPPWSA